MSTYFQCKLFPGLCGQSKEQKKSNACLHNAEVKYADAVHRSYALLDGSSEEIWKHIKLHF